MDIAIASPYKLTRKSLCSLLVSVRDLRVVVDVENAIDGFEQMHKARPQILLMASGNPDRDLETVRKLQKLLPELRILLLVEGDNEDFELRAVHAGAWGCISTQAEPQTLEKALRVVENGEMWVRRRVATRIIGKAGRCCHTLESELPSEVTQREWEVLALIAKGHRNKEIAGCLSISEHTVKTHLRVIYRKLQVSTRLEAALYYFREPKHDGNGVAASISWPAPSREKPAKYLVGSD